jgi:hypothetical protein
MNGGQDLWVRLDRCPGVGGLRAARGEVIRTISSLPISRTKYARQERFPTCTKNP